MLVPFSVGSKHWVLDYPTGIEYPSKEALVKGLIEKNPSIGKELTDYISYLNSLLYEVGKEMPPLTKDDLIQGGGLVDKGFERDLESWIDRTFREWDLTDEVHNVYEWELLPLSRFTSSTIEVEGQLWWCLVDGESDGEYIDYYELDRLRKSFDIDNPAVSMVEGSDAGVFSEEWEVEELANSLNRCMGEAEHGYPFAWNTYWEVPTYIPIDLIQGAGFVVYEDPEESKCFMGVDGGGYSFITHHWAPLYIAYCIERNIMVSTSTGERRVAMGK